MTATIAPPPPPTSGPPGTAPPPHGRGRFRGPRARRAWRVGGAIVTALLLVAALFQIITAIAHTTSVQTRSLTADDLRGVRTIEVRNQQGRVDVVGTDHDGIEARTEIREGLRPPTVDWTIDGDRLVVRATCPWFASEWCRVDHHIEVPSDLEVIVHAEHDDVRISDIDAAVDARTEHGSLELVRIAGPVRMRTDHGSARAAQLTAPTLSVRAAHGAVQVEFAATPQRIDVDAEFADVDIAVPDDGTTYAVSTVSTFGETVNNLPTDPRGESVIEVRTMFGRITLGHTP